MDASVGSVTHSAKFTLPSLSVSYRLQASRVLLPLTLTSSQFQVTWRVSGRPASSTQSWVRSFCPGSSLAPAVSLTQLSAARTDEDAKKATPSARNDATPIASKNREGDLVNVLNDLLVRLRNDVNIEGLLTALKELTRKMACTIGILC